MRKIAYILGTGLGCGYVPVAPGTVGSFAALLIYYLLPLTSYYWMIIITLFIAAGIWSSALIEKEKGKDPAMVVIDEWAGQWLAILFLPRTIPILLIAFILFRIADIVKPFPIRKSQKIRGGLGIMIDDLIAALYVNVCLQFSVRLFI